MTGTAKKRIHIAGGFLLLVVALVLLFFWNIYSGSVSVEPKDVLRLLFQGPDESTQARILWDIRFPRVLAAMLLGGALSVSGFLLQTFFANPIAGPFVLGISSGAKLMTALVMIFLLGRGLVAGSVVLILASFIGAMLSMGFVILIANKVNNMSILVICGIMVSYICSAVTDLVVTFADDSNIVNLHNWSLGSFSGITWESYEDSLLVPDAEPLISYILSCHGNQNQYLLDKYTDFRGFVSRKVKGGFHITKDAGIFLCEK